MKRVRGVLIVALAALGMSSVHGASQAPRPTRVSLAAVLARAGSYVIEYGQQLRDVLAEEDYEQRLVWRHDRATKDTRTLRSEIAFVRLADSTEWLAFRNVMAVDGQSIPESAGRLERLMRVPPRSLQAQAQQLAAESARYNIGPITREINMPITALHYLHPRHQPVSRFSKAREDVYHGGPVWVVEFDERDRGTLIRRGDGRNIPARGRFWIVPTDGRVVRTELEVEDFVRGGENSTARIQVTWRVEAALGLLVPSEMREQYEGPWHAWNNGRPRQRYDIEGTATYSNFRRFTADFRIK